MPKITRKRIAALVAILMLLSVGAWSQRFIKTEDEPFGAKLSRVGQRVTTTAGWRRIWNNSQEPFLERIGWQETKIVLFSIDVQFTSNIILHLHDLDDGRRPGLLATYGADATEMM